MQLCGCGSAVCCGYPWLMLALHSLRDRSTSAVSTALPTARYIEPSAFDFGSDLAAFAKAPIMTDEIFGPLFPIARFSEIEDVVQFCRKLPTGKPLALYLYRSLRARCHTGPVPGLGSPPPRRRRDRLRAESAEPVAVGRTNPTLPFVCTGPRVRPRPTAARPSAHCSAWPLSERASARRVALRSGRRLVRGFSFRQLELSVCAARTGG